MSFIKTQFSATLVRLTKCMLRIARGIATPSTSGGQAGMSRTPSSWTVDMSTRRSILDKLSSGEATSIIGPVDNRRSSLLGFQATFRPSNIVQLFQNFSVKMEFDLLSVDTDSYDWFMIEAILEAGYRPRVICTEINSSSV